MFERFTDRARAVVKGAVAESRTLGHEKVGTEHLLLAMLDDTPEGGGGGVAGRVLREAGVTADDLRARIEAHVGSGSRALSDADAEALRQIGIDLEAVRRKVEAAFGEGALRPPARPHSRGLFGLRRRRPMTGGPFSPRAKKALELSLREALRLKHRYIGTEHVLLGVLREGEGLGVMVLTEAGFEVDDLRRRVEAAIRAAA
ncbi:Clp protease N-terminal domain-containing protein [Asanoa sp. WMMD1127]|uniref:Clp protease N-terminal domain-containing protein n=1 Tax=Asanoa sp. WMMD1127 TaxID=3016107 RepID=UPI00241686DB|nr:Clp protease N-terminal domain-containing protein [Asanoa sp. WMMD1127]MDG4824005.1 Clp protease N-terminal domain-containing protein [Asanoa sp. WMMD1127]